MWINKILSKCQIVDFSKPNAHERWAVFLDLFAFYYPKFYHFTKFNFEISSYLIKPGLFCNFLHQDMWLFIVIHFIYYNSPFKQVVCSMVTMLCTDLCKFHNALQTSQNSVLIRSGLRLFPLLLPLRVPKICVWLKPWHKAYRICQW